MRRYIEIDSFNPYEKYFPNRKLVDKDTLTLIKLLREDGHDVIIKPRNDIPVQYLFKKGILEFFTNPFYAYLSSIPTGIVLNLISDYLKKKLERKPEVTKKEIYNNIIIIDNSKNIFSNLDGKNFTKGEQIDLKKKKEKIQANFGQCLDLRSPYPNLPTPIFYEHKPRIVGWSSIIVDDMGIKIKDSQIIDKNIFRKIETGKIKGGSMTGIAEKSVCSICGSDYVNCNHIAGEKYNNNDCINHIEKATGVEFSLVKNPINPECLVSIVKNGNK
ncbi:hypothetical protein CLV51_11334 [Chitinophaga niastensis]|uniref:Uncharacterized protein n=1 Tax=Chitinophaga niastensis TaxID=536980 RepID=A0A2P8H844_CHINA|nr:hypothetical protein [Chitinophaga niastensis]PSL42396.1 hypothetical protein CLV51_11334 [Chitinophaga niastensis]